MEPGIASLATTLTAEAKDDLNLAAMKIKHCLDQLDDEQVWWRPHESMNAIENLILHLCGNVRQWILSGLGGAEDRRDRPREFSESRKLCKAELVAQLDEVVAAASKVLGEVTPEELLRARRIQGFTVTGLGAIFGSVPHFKGHTQEIVCLTRMQLGDSYKFYWVPKTIEEGAAVT
jgi:hypothetical protein